jgi:hypothetical protein
MYNKYPMNLTTEHYQLIQHALGDNFPWYRQVSQGTESTPSINTQNPPFFSHMLMSRSSDPDQDGQINSEYFQGFKSIFDACVPAYTHIYRASLNCVHAAVTPGHSRPHYDHDFDHNNWIFYLNDSTAHTLLFDQELNIVERIPARALTAVSFDRKLHAHEFPEDNSHRLVIVFTYK